MCRIIEPKSLQVNWETIRLQAVGQPTELLLHTNSALVEEDISCNVFGKQSYHC
jgi:hypothetical protein